MKTLKSSFKINWPLAWPHFLGKLMHSQFRMCIFLKKKLISMGLKNIFLNSKCGVLSLICCQLIPKWTQVQSQNECFSEKYFIPLWIGRENQVALFLSFFFGNTRHEIFIFLPLQQYLYPSKGFTSVYLTQEQNILI